MSQSALKPPASILFVKPESAGDLVLYVPLLAWIRRHWPETRVGLLLRSKYRDLGPLLPPGVIPLFTQANPSREAKADSSEWEPLTRQVAEFAPEVVVASSYEKNRIHALAAAAAPAARRISLGPANFDAATGHYLRQNGVMHPGDAYQEIVAVPRDAHELEKSAMLLGHVCGIEPPPLSPQIQLPEKSFADARAWLEGKGLRAKEFIICNPAGSANVPIKEWPAGSFAKVISWLRQERGLPVLICAHADEEPQVDRVLASLGSAARPEIWLGGDGQFLMMAALVSQAKGYFGTDTSTLHVAEAVGTPAAGVFGGGTWPRFRPVTGRSVAFVHPLPCFGCGWDCHFGDAPCVKLVKEEDVITGLKGWLIGDEAPDKPARTAALAHLPPPYLESIRKSRELYDGLRQDHRARYGQILELTATVRRGEKDIAALNAATGALQADLRAQAQQEIFARGAQKDIVELTALVRHHETESGARYSQIVELTALVHRHEQRLEFVGSELAAYRTENDRLATELALARKVLSSQAPAPPGAIGSPSGILRLPRTDASGDDILYHLDRHEAGELLFHISGWAFCPRIDCTNAIVSLLLDDGRCQVLARPSPVTRPDVAAAYALADLGPSLPVGSPGRLCLARSGFEGHWERSLLDAGSGFAIGIQIDGPDFSVRKSTEFVLHA